MTAQSERERVAGVIEAVIWRSWNIDKATAAVTTHVQIGVEASDIADAILADSAALRAELEEAIRAAYREGEENGIRLAGKQPDALHGWENSRARAFLDRGR